MISIGWRNLKRAPLRFSVAIGGVAFAVMLITCEIGMMFGMTRNASILVDRSRADLFVSAQENKTFDFCGPIARRKKFQVSSIPGVARVEEFNVPMSLWRTADGSNAPCQIVAMDIDGQLGPPLNMVVGSINDLQNQNAVIIDESAHKILGAPEVGDYVEVFKQRARVVGICQDMQSFSTIPMVFTSLNKGDMYGWASGNGSQGQEESFYFMVGLEPGADPEQVRQEIASSVLGVEVHTRESLSWRTRRFWLIETGIGMAFFFVGFLGLLVGGVILSQTLFALTMERLTEFGVLKALGAGMVDLSRVVLEQGLACGGCGLVLGLSCSFAVQALARAAKTEIEISLPLMICVTVLALLLSACASLLSIARLRKLEPASIFRT